MQVMRVSSNYNQNKTNFKGEAEQRIFQRLMKTSEFKEILKQPGNDETNKMVIEYFQKKFNNLKKTFAKTYEITSYNSEKEAVIENLFVFKPNKKEKIYVQFLQKNEQPAIAYSERTVFAPGVYKKELTGYTYAPKDEQLQAMFIKTNLLSLYNIGKMAKAKGYKGYTTIINQVLGDNISPNKFQTIAMEAKEATGNKIVPCPIPRRSKNK